MHSTTFGVSDKLQLELQRACGSAAVGGLQIHIRNETFELGETLPTVSAPALLKAAITPLLDERAPCYLLLSLQSEWALASWVPDAAGVRDKMLYSSDTIDMHAYLRSATWEKSLPNHVHSVQ